MKIFVSGASGFLGNKICHILSIKHDVFALVRASSQVKFSQNEKIVYVDDHALLQEAFMLHKPDLLINVAALYGRKGESFSELISSNIDLPCKLLSLCEEFGVKGFINTGTSLPDNVSPYSLTKNTFVKLAKMMTSSNVKFINLSLEHFYGVGDSDSKFTSYVLSSLLKNQDLNLTEGLQRRDFIHVDDVVGAYVIIVDRFSELANGETIDIGSGEAPTIRSFVETLKRLTDSTSNVNFGAVPTRANEPILSCANISRISSLGWKCQYSLDCGLKTLLNTKN
jgi:CDP-paratose synthetase